MDPIVAMKRQIINKFAKTGLDLAQAYNDMPTGSSVYKPIKAFETKLQKAEFDSLDSMLAALSEIENCSDSTGRESDCAKRIGGHLSTAFRLFQDVIEFMDAMNAEDKEDKEDIQILYKAAGVKQAVTAFLVRDCGGQLKRPFPVRSSDQSDEEYKTRLQHWLYEKASYKVQLIHRIKEAEAPEEMKTGESVPSRSQSTPVGAADAADDVPQPAIDEHARHRNLNVVHDKDVKLLCNKLKASKYHFPDVQLQEIHACLANCQYRKGTEFNLRLKSTPEDPRPEQRTSVKHFVEDLRRRLDKRPQATDSGKASEQTAQAADQIPTPVNGQGTRPAAAQASKAANSDSPAASGAGSDPTRGQTTTPANSQGKRHSSKGPVGLGAGLSKRQKTAQQAPQPSSISVREQIATDFKRTEQCLIRLDACQRKIDTCQTTIEQYRASGMDIQDELADLTKLQHEKAILTDSLPDLVRKFKIALHDNV